jgi:hypothetical protein
MASSAKETTMPNTKTCYEPSAEFARYRALFAAYGEACARADHDGPGLEADEIQRDAAFDAHAAAMLAVLTRDVFLWDHVVEIAQVIVAELWLTDESGNPTEHHSENEKLDHALLRAVLTMAARRPFRVNYGGAHG